MNCERCRGLLSEFEADELAERTAAEVRAHLAECQDCAGLLAAMQHLTAMTDDLREEEPSRMLSLRILRAVDDLLAPDFTDAPEIMTPEQLARFLRVPIEQLEEEMLSLPAFEIGGHLRFRKQVVLEWIEERERQHSRTTFYAPLRAI